MSSNHKNNKNNNNNNNNNKTTMEESNDDGVLPVAMDFEKLKASKDNLKPQQRRVKFSPFTDVIGDENKTKPFGGCYEASETSLRLLSLEEAEASMGSFPAFAAGESYTPYNASRFQQFDPNPQWSIGSSMTGGSSISTNFTTGDAGTGATTTSGGGGGMGGFKKFGQNSGVCYHIQMVDMAEDESTSDDGPAMDEGSGRYVAN